MKQEKGITANNLQKELAKGQNEKRSRRTCIRDRATGREYLVDEIIKEPGEEKNRLLLGFDSNNNIA
jgi:hypothetical protein